MEKAFGRRRDRVFGGIEPLGVRIGQHLHRLLGARIGPEARNPDEMRVGRVMGLDGVGDILRGAQVEAVQRRTRLGEAIIVQPRRETVAGVRGDDLRKVDLHHRVDLVDVIGRGGNLGNCDRRLRLSLLVLPVPPVLVLLLALVVAIVPEQEVEQILCRMRLRRPQHHHRRKRARTGGHKLPVSHQSHPRSSSPEATALPKRSRTIIAQCREVKARSAEQSWYGVLLRKRELS